VVLAVAVLLTALVVAAVPGPRSAVARFLGIGGVRVVTTGDVPAAVAGAYDLGEPVPVDRALAQAPGAMSPDGAGDPVAAFTGRPEGAVTLVWAAGDDLPDLDAAGTTGVGLIVTAFPGSIDAPVVIKRIGPATRAEAVRLGGAVGYWISGAPHEVQVLGSSGEARPDVVRLAGNTLLWTDGATTYRLESALDREAAVEVAERIPAAGS
jgi:hypothetical protein